MKVAVMGAGAMGGYFGGRLAEAGHEVWLIARGAHLDALKRDGLRILSPKGDAHIDPINATDEPAEVGVADVILFTVKNRDVEPAAEAVMPMLGADTFAITVQNGVTAWSRLAAIIGEGRVLPGVARIPGDIVEPGVVRHSADLDMISFGEPSGGSSERVRVLEAAFDAAGVTPSIPDNIIHDLWRKFCFQSTFASMTALTRLDVGPIRRTPEAAALFRAAVEEAHAVGKAIEPGLPDDIPDSAWHVANTLLPEDVHASMLDDLVRGKPIELEYLSGEVVRLGREHGVPTPIHSVLYAVLKPTADLLEAAAV